MKIEIDNNEALWFKEWFEEVDPEVGFKEKISEIKITSKGGFLIFTNLFKCYLHPNSKALKRFQEWLEENDNQTVPHPCVCVVARYPFWGLEGDESVTCEIHNYDDKEIQLTPTPSEGNQTTKTRRKAK